jgi:hypothetical protein
MKQRLSRADLFEIVSEGMRPEHHNDKPAIRQAMNDTADSYRKGGYNVPDYDQAKFVADIQAYLKAKL